jgi:hypothetical protein
MLAWKSPSVAFWGDSGKSKEVLGIELGIEVTDIKQGMALLHVGNVE